MDKKSLYLSISGLMILLIGCIAVCLMGFSSRPFYYDSLWNPPLRKSLQMETGE